MERIAGEHRQQLLAAPGADGGAAVQGERDVTAEAGGEHGKGVPIEPEPPQFVERDQRCRRVGAAAGHAARHRMPLTIEISTSGAIPASAASISAAFQTRLVWSVGTDSAPSPRTRTDSASDAITDTSSARDSAWKTVRSSW